MFIDCFLFHYPEKVFVVLAVTGADKTVSIYSAKGGWVLCYETKLANSIHDIKWNSNARFLAFISQDKTKV